MLDHHENHIASCHAIKVPAAEEAVSVISDSDLGARISLCQSGDSDKSVDFCNSVGKLNLDGRFVGRGCPGRVSAVLLSWWKISPSSTCSCLFHRKSY